MFPTCSTVSILIARQLDFKLDVCGTIYKNLRVTCPTSFIFINLRIFAPFIVHAIYIFQIIRLYFYTHPLRISPISMKIIRTIYWIICMNYNGRKELLLSFYLWRNLPQQSSIITKKDLFLVIITVHSLRVFFLFCERNCQDVYIRSK